MPDVQSDVANFLGEGHTPIVTPCLHLSWHVWLESSWCFFLLPGSGFLGLLLRGILRCWRFSPPLHKREVARHIVPHTQIKLSPCFPSHVNSAHKGLKISRTCTSPTLKEELTSSLLSSPNVCEVTLGAWCASRSRLTTAVGCAVPTSGSPPPPSHHLRVPRGQPDTLECGQPCA